MKNKKAQVTIFIILALIIIVAILLLFVLIKKPEIQPEDAENPQAYIESCAREATEEAISLLSEQGGDISPKGTMFREKNISYLCYNSAYYLPCINQKPTLIEHIQNEISSYIEPKIESCFNSLQTKLEEKNYDIEMGEMNLTTKLQAKQVLVNIDRDFKMTKRESTRHFNNFKMSLVHPVYDLSKIAMEIANQEARFCNFDILGYMIFYPDYDLDKFRPGDSDTIYQIRHIPTNQRFVFAVKSCALPPGF